MFSPVFAMKENNNLKHTIALIYPFCYLGSQPACFGKGRQSNNRNKPFPLGPRHTNLNKTR